MIALEVNNDQVYKFTARLKSMHKSDFPIAVRQTLNDLAFDTKQKTLPNEFKRQFTRRNKTFLKSQSGVKKVDGWNVSTMQSEVGITPREQGGEAAKELTLQEFGGVKRKSNIYIKAARGGSNKRPVQPARYFNKMDKLRGKPSWGNKYARKSHYNMRSRKANFIASAITAHKLGKLLMWNSKSGQTLFLIQSIYLGANGIARVNAIPIADYEQNRMLRIKARPFLKPASDKSQVKAEQFFIRNAKKRFERGHK
jgi:hypothetical protein